MEFKGSIKISRYKVDNACTNFKNIHNEMMKLLREKKEELKTIVMPVYLFGIKVPYLKSTKYEDLGFNGDFIDRHYALDTMIEEIFKELPDGNVKKLLEIYNTDLFSSLVKCYHELDNLRSMETDWVTINPQQAKFVSDYYSVDNEG